MRRSAGAIENAVDFELAADPATGEYDLALASNGDLKTVDNLSTAILVSLLTDARASADQVATQQLRRGWIGNAAPPVPGYELGSLIWLMAPANATQGNANLAASFARSSLQWLVDENIASAVEVVGSITGPRRGELEVTITARDGRVERQYIELWERTSFQALGLPAPIQELPPFTPASVPGLVMYGDADFSEHNLDVDCGVISIQDIAGTSDLVQATPTNRPRRLLGSGGWFYRFDGVDDHVATANITLQNFNQGSLFMILRPAETINAGDRMITLGFNGFTDAVRGLSIRQQLGDVLRLAADNGNLEVDIQGSPNASPSIGVVFRWGPASTGGSAETSTLQAESDGEYTNDIGSPNQIVVGAGFGGSAPDAATAAAFDCKLFSLWDRKISDVELANLLDLSFERAFTSPVNESFFDCTYFEDDEGWIDG